MQRTVEYKSESPRRMSTTRSTKHKFPHTVIVRAPVLLPMLYKTRELAEDLGVDRQMIISWVKNGAPHKRDRKGHIWIQGQILAGWVESQRKSKSRKEYPLDHGYCFRCREMVRMENISRRRMAKLIFLSGACIQCGGKVNRGSSDG